MIDIRRCYDILTRELAVPPAEPVESAIAVERQRQFWRPKRVDIILLAESHVHTDGTELKSQVDTLAFNADESYPREFTRFVYCLGYGEQTIVNISSDNGNAGTPQYWKLLTACQSVSEMNAILKSKTRTDMRLRTKYELLQRLQAKGVWLVDASITAIYHHKKPRPSRAVVDRTLQLCWDHFIKWVILAAKPKHVIVIGRGVHETLQSRLSNINIPNTPVYQPQARISKTDRANDFSTIKRICSKHCPD